MRYLLILCCALALNAQAGEVKVAVAANFAVPLQALASDFKAQSGHSLQISSGATGKLFAQISNGAPFEVLLAADDETPTKLADNNLAIKDTLFTYATGRLVLWALDGDTPNENTLKHKPFNKLAIANPKVAPYGRAAEEVFGKLGIRAAITPKLVLGENVAQAQQFVASGNADYGLIAASLVTFDGQFTQGKGWLVPAAWHQTIKQDAVLLKTGQNNPAASAFLQYLRSAKAKKIIAQYGYE
jgi:molybdate transport system substrate-binding protein